MVSECFEHRLIAQLLTLVVEVRSLEVSRVQSNSIVKGVNLRFREIRLRYVSGEFHLKLAPSFEKENSPGTDLSKSPN